jgi:hypothetical protein
MDNSDETDMLGNFIVMRKGRLQYGDADCSALVGASL